VSRRGCNSVASQTGLSRSKVGRVCSSQLSGEINPKLEQNLFLVIEALIVFLQRLFHLHQFRDVMDSVKAALAKVPTYMHYSPDAGLAEQAPAFYLLLAALILIPLVALVKSQQPKLKLPPSPPAWPIMGHLPLLGKLPHQSMANLAKKYGEIYHLRLGSVPAIVVTTPEMAKEFLQTYDKIWASRTTNLASAFYFSYNYTGLSLSLSLSLSKHAMSDGHW
jgi:hypothetical protein